MHGTLPPMSRLALLFLLLVAPAARAEVAVPPPSPDAELYHLLGLVLVFASRCWTVAVPGLLLVSGLGLVVFNLLF